MSISLKLITETSLEHISRIKNFLPKNSKLKMVKIHEHFNIFENSKIPNWDAFPEVAGCYHLGAAWSC